MRHRFVAVPAAVVAFAAVMAVPGTACACSCVASGPRERVERAAVAFTGTVVALRRVPAATPGPPPSIVYVFRADQVYRGRTGTRIEVASSTSGAACGYSFDVGSRYLVLASDGGRSLAGSDPGVALSTGICHGNLPVRAGDRPLRERDGIHRGEPLRRELLAALGTPEPPSSSSSDGGMRRRGR
ncbi:hypothetical protein ACIBCT_19625 [Streptosporangium sp. NPDC050855]|uniref:hypothetical protein n=1 Tax=Streptosporangium sp. NPDC050855 TaxID=3366194 RepID=UPI003788502A